MYIFTSLWARTRHLSIFQYHQNIFNIKSKPYKKQHGFTIIELMIVIVIIATLTAVALPSFRNYTARAKVSEALAALAPAKVLIAEAFLNNEMPVADYAMPAISSKYVRGLSYTRQDESHGYVTVSTQNLGAGLDDGLSFSLYARGSDSGIDWDCAQANENPLPEDFLPSQCKDAPPRPSDEQSYYD